MTECFVCVETYDKRKKKQVICPYCKYEACQKCWRIYILGSVIDPHCMKCNRYFSREILNDNMGKTWVNIELKKHRENVLMEREKALLPNTQVYVKYHMKIEDLDTKLKNLTDQINEIRSEENKILCKIYAIKHKKNQIRNILNRATEIQNPNPDPDIENESEEDKKERQFARFTRACSKEDCRGFLSTAYKCGICNSYACPQCFGLKKGKYDPEHKCNPDDIETAKYIKSRVKTCPKCGQGIQKISGCSQIWCTTCHTAFDYKTMKIVHGRIHNPHYYEWRNSQGYGGNLREQGDIPCGGLPWYGEVSRAFLNAYNIQQPRNCNSNVPDHPQLKKLLAVHRTITHIQNVELRNLQNNEDEDNVVNRYFRIKYMRNMIDENYWKKQLQRREKAREKNIQICQILEMYTNTVSDFFRQIVTSNKATIKNNATGEAKIENNAANKAEIENISAQITQLTNYVNSQFDILRSRYNNVIPRITKDYQFKKGETKKITR